MDLHEIFETLQAAGFKGADVVIGVDCGAGESRTMHRCSCGYITDKIEVMAIHAVRAHGYPCSPGATDSYRGRTFVEGMNRSTSMRPTIRSRRGDSTPDLDLRPLAANHPGYWTVEGDVLALGTKDDSGNPTSVGRP